MIILTLRDFLLNKMKKIMSVMLKVSEDLEANWKSYDDDAYVNAWDIGNYVADYLNDRIGNESCTCSHEIFKGDE